MLSGARRPLRLAQSYPAVHTAVTSAAAATAVTTSSTASEPVTAHSPAAAAPAPADAASARPFAQLLHAADSGQLANGGALRASAMVLQNMVLMLGAVGSQVRCTWGTCSLS